MYHFIISLQHVDNVAGMHKPTNRYGVALMLSHVSVLFHQGTWHVSVSPAAVANIWLPLLTIPNIACPSNLMSIDVTVYGVTAPLYHNHYFYNCYFALIIPMAPMLHVGQSSVERICMNRKTQTPGGLQPMRFNELCAAAVARNCRPWSGG